MKKLMNVCVCLIIALQLFTGCESDSMTEEELRAEVKAELLSDEEMMADLKDSIKEELIAEMAAEEKDLIEDKEQLNEDEFIEEATISMETINEEESQITDLDWILDYIDVDIEQLYAEIPEGELSQDYMKTLTYNTDAHELTFVTIDPYTFQEYSEDFQAANLTEDSISDIWLRIPYQYYNNETSRYEDFKDVSVNGYMFGMSEEEITLINAKPSIGIFEFDYGREEFLCSIFIKSQKVQDVLDGKYAKAISFEPVDPSQIKTINLGMSKDEIIAILGSDYTESIVEDFFEGKNIVTLEYEEVSVSFDEADGIVHTIEIISNGIALDPNIMVGQSALEVLAYCDENYNKAVSIHDPNPIFGLYYIGDSYAGIRLEFDRYNQINSIEDVTEDTMLIGVTFYKAMNINGV
jgi:hypothetical protein